MTIMRYRTIRLEVVNTRGVERRNIMSADGTTYLYTHWIFDFDCRYNPAATSYRRGATPVQQAGVFPFETDEALQHYLSQPRGQLEVDMGNGLLVRSPNLGSATDAKNGPWVEECSIARVMGEKQFLVHMRIHTWVNRCTKSSEGGSLNPLISHRWRRYVDIDQDHFSTIVTEGEATFRTDLLLAAQTYPDAYRRDLFHPVPPNCQRGPIRVEAMSDGTGVRYHFADYEKAFNYGADCPATRIEAYATAGYSRRGPIDVAISAIPEMIQAGADAFQTSSPWSIAGRGTAGAARVAASAALAMLPKYHVRCFCRAWGNRNSSRTKLTSLAMGLCLGRFGPLLFRSEEKILTHDLCNQFVEFDVTVSWGLEVALANNMFAGIAEQVLPGLEGLGGGQFPITWDQIVHAFPDDNGTITAPGLNLSKQPGLTNPRPPESDGTRGTWLGKLVHQALSGSCEVPPAPPAHAKTLNLAIY